MTDQAAQRRRRRVPSRSEALVSSQGLAPARSEVRGGSRKPPSPLCVLGCSKHEYYYYRLRQGSLKILRKLSDFPDARKIYIRWV